MRVAVGRPVLIPVNDRRGDRWQQKAALPGFMTVSGAHGGHRTREGVRRLPCHSGGYFPAHDLAASVKTNHAVRRVTYTDSGPRRYSGIGFIKSKRLRAHILFCSKYFCDEQNLAMRKEERARKDACASEKQRRKIKVWFNRFIGNTDPGESLWGIDEATAYAAGNIVNAS